MKGQLAQGTDFSPVLSANPGQDSLIRRLLLCEPSFRELCEDYLTVLDLIEAFDPDAAPGQKGAFEEYVRLGAELELDIKRALLRSSQKSGS